MAMFGSSVLFAITTITSTILLALAYLARSTLLWIVPNDWEQHSPSVRVEYAGLGFVMLNTVLFLLCLLLWLRMRSFKQREYD